MALPKLVAHRGLGNPYTAALNIAENSVPAILYSAKHGAFMLECDVQVSGKSPSGSRTMFIMHDELLDRTTNGTGTTNDRPWTYISGLWLETPRDLNGNNDFDNTTARVPTLNDWLKAGKTTGLPLHIELKGALWTEAQVKKFAEAVKAQGLESKSIISGGATKLGYAKKYLPGAARSYSVSEFPAIETVKKVAGPTGYAPISLAAAEKSPTYVKNLQAAGIRVFVYTLDTASHYKRALPFNFYGWMCDSVENAEAWLAANVV